MSRKINYAIITLFIVALLSVFFLDTFIKSIKRSRLPEPYKSIKLMPFNNHGWYVNAAEMKRLIKPRNIKIIIEIGSWMGASTRHMATLIPEDGKIYAVDTWKGSPNEQYDPKVLETVYEQFLSNIIHSNLAHKIIPIRMESIAAAKTLKVSPDLIYLDATHTYESVLKDLHSWFPLVKGHGIMCGDDFSWGDGGVGRAVTQFAKENNLDIYTNQQFWYLIER